MKRNLFFLFLILSLTACSPRIIEHAKVDSVYVERIVEVRDTIVKIEIPEQSLRIQTLDTASHLETSVAISDACISAGVLTHSLINKNALLPIIVSIPKETVHTNTVTIDKGVEVREVEKPLSWWQKTLLYLSAIIVVITVIRIVMKYVLKI